MNQSQIKLLRKIAIEADKVPSLIKRIEFLENALINTQRTVLINKIGLGKMKTIGSLDLDFFITDLSDEQLKNATEIIKERMAIICEEMGIRSLVLKIERVSTDPKKNKRV